MSNQGFDKNSGPGTGIPKQQTAFGFRPPFQSPSSWFNDSSQKPEGHQSPAVPPIIPSRNPGTEFPPKTQVQDLKRSRSPPSLSTYNDILQDSRTVVGSHFVPQISKSPSHDYQRNPSRQGFGPLRETKRPSISPPRLNARHNSYPDPEIHVLPPQSADLYKSETPANNPSDIPVPKRSRLPYPASTNPTLQANSSSADDDVERELQAKAKRLARFRDELSQPEQSDPGNRNQKAQQVGQLGMEKRTFIPEASDTTGLVRNNNLLPDGEDQHSSTVIIGYCPDMCPEQERAERERKGDLDQHERLDGDRNQTAGSLAVKKYTRTAEREAALIRPMPILQKTMGYLLDLLDQPYDDRLLGLYNFLWDRMRAIRMDLRMQHIFNLGAITMLEQMIRLHILAMHELCQYTKGEGFSEGFDAHLNIEQMNKTSVELFQLYDDHRKKGIEVPTEREFRGYYALLKLDKHPGYKVEPSELSLDLAKMTPGIRQAAEVLFARKVARACRTGNFVVFFRLVRKASYLQACLMHAHFGKLRTQGLASLHSGLQNNQGIPVPLVAKWLGMEEENMEDLLDYHGFSIKEYDEPYMVKERQFLNGDNEYPLKCSKLVHLKRSTTVVDDVLFSSLMEFEAPKRVPVDITSMEEESPIVEAIDEDIAEYEPASLVKDDEGVHPLFHAPAIDRWNVEVATPSPVDIFKANNHVGSPKVVKPSYDTWFRNSFEKHNQPDVSARPTQVVPRKVLVETLPDLPMDSSFEESTIHPVFVEDPVPEEPSNVIQQVANEIDISIDEEVAEAKLKLILRIWRRRASVMKDLRDKKRLAANAALSSLPLGPPMRHYEEQSKVSSQFNFDRAMSVRHEKQERLWSTLNVSNVVADILGQRNDYPRCICWKLLLCSFDHNLGSWLRYKLMPENVSNTGNLVSFSGLSIWKKWDAGKSSGDRSCYLSMVKNVQLDNILEETISGASAIIFQASESISWAVQKIRLFNIISLIPHGSCLPLLIVSGFYERRSQPSIVVQNLGLDEVDRSRIGSFSVVPLFDDERLRKGLEWLASQSPVQPIVHRVKTRDLVLKHVNILSNGARKTSPEDCISAINEAVDETIEEICNSAKANPIGWPCPEISLLNEFDRKLLEPYMPSIGWSSVSRIDPLIETLKNCKLPNTPKGLSRPMAGIEIEQQRLELEDFLVSYLTPLTGLPLAQKEASTLIQTCVGLELHGPTYRLVPKWVMVFRRVFSWRLTGLTNGPFSTVYISDELCHRHDGLESLEDEWYDLRQAPTLDEMIGVSSLEMGYEDSKTVVCKAPEMEMAVSEDDESVQEEEGDYSDDERSLSRLLEQCNIVQDMIDKKLSIYF